MTATHPTLVDRFRDPLADPTYDRRRIRLAVMMGAMGIAHFVVPGPFRRIVPSWFPWVNEAVAVSGVAELVSGALLVNPKTERAGGVVTAATLLAVYPANIQMAIDASRGSSDLPFRPGRLGTLMLWLRLPMQWPMLATALRSARRGR